PERLDAGESGLSRSQLSCEGMEPEAVLRLLGSPVYRNRLGRTGLWRYSSETLDVEDGKLSDIR
ncbi:MAG: hypothetical protein WAO20_00250, partial [Acidobacteriota bacterium]